MATYIITHDLSSPGRNYAEFYDKIKAISDTWAHITESSWIVTDDNLESEKIRDTLMQAIDSSDKLFVGKLAREAVWFGLSGSQTAWL